MHTSTRAHLHTCTLAHLHTCTLAHLHTTTYSFLQAGNVKLSPHLLKGHQEHAKAELKCDEEKPLFLVRWR